jgi:hypothetical protein
MSTCIYDKTDKGREEIATRKYQVPPKLRTLLVMIDGRHSLESLLKNFAVLGLSKDNVDELERQGFIALVSGGPESDETDAEAMRAPRPPASRARAAARQEQLAQAEPEAPPPEGPPELHEGEPPSPKALAARRPFFDYFNLASDSVNVAEF